MRKGAERASRRGGAITAGALLALVVAVLLQNPYGAEAFEPDRMALLRAIVALMTAAAIGSVWQRGGAGWTEEIAPWRGPWARMLAVALAGEIVMVAVATAGAASPALAWSGAMPRLHGAHAMLALLALVPLSAIALRATRAQRLLVATLHLAASSSCFYGLLQRLGHDPVRWSKPWELRPVAFQGNPVWLGAVLAMALPFAVAETAAAAVRGRRAAAAGYGALAALELLTLLVGGGRGPLLGAAVGGGFALLAWMRRFARRRRIVAVAVLAAAVALLAALPALAPQSAVGRRVASALRPSGTAQARLLLWRGTIATLSDSPVRLWIGRGPDGLAPELQRHLPEQLPALAGQVDITHDRAHDDPLDSTATLGVPGALFRLAQQALVLALALSGLAGALDRRRRARLLIMLVAAPAAAGALAWMLSGGHAWTGTATLLGLVAGAALWLLVDAPPSLGDHDVAARLLRTALLAALAAHLVEIAFAFDVASTATLWALLAGLLVATAGQPTAEALCATPVLAANSAGRRKETAVMAPRQARAGALLATLALGVIAFGIWVPPHGDTAGSMAGVPILLVATALAAALLCHELDGPAGLSAFVTVTVPWVGLYLLVLRAIVAENEPVLVLTLLLLHLGAALIALAFACREPAGPTSSRREAAPARQRQLVTVIVVGLALAVFFTADLPWLRAELSLRQARTAFDDGEFAAAADHYARTVELAPTLQEATLGAARSRMRLAVALPREQRNEALAAVARELAEDERRQGESAALTAELAYLQARWSAADPIARDEHLARARALYARAAELAPADPAIARQQAAVLLDAGKLDDAAAQLERAARLGPQSQETFLMLGRVELERRHAAGARAALQRALQLDADRALRMLAGIATAHTSDWRAQRDLAALAAVAGDRATAAAAFNAAMEAAPERASELAALLDEVAAPPH